MTRKSANQRTHPISDNNRRLICRIVFLAICLLPTCLTSYWILHQPSAQDWQTQIQAKLGLEVDIENVETPVPGVTILRGVQLIDSNRGPISQVKEIEIRAGAQNQILFHDRIEVSPRELERMIQQMVNHASQFCRLDESWQVLFDKLAIRHADRQRGITLKPVEIHLARNPSGVTAQTQFQVSEDGQAHTYRCRVDFPGSTEQVGPRIRIETGNGSLPCWLASQLLPPLQQLGAVARFSGTADVQLDERYYVSGWIDGTFDNIDLEQLAGAFGHQMRGWASATQQCELQQGRIKRLLARVHCPQIGSISAGTLSAAEKHLNLELAGQVDTSWIPIDSSAINLSYDPNDALGPLLIAGPDWKREFLNNKRGIPILRCRIDQADNLMRTSLDDFARFVVDAPANVPLETAALHQVLDIFHQPPIQRTASSGDMQSDHY